MSFLSSRRLLGVALAGGVLAVAACVLLAASGLLSWAEALLLVIGPAGVAGVAFSVLKLRGLARQLTRVERRLRAAIDTGATEAAVEVLAAAGELRLEAAELNRRMTALEEAGRAGFERAAVTGDELSRGMAGLAESGRTGAERIEAATGELSRRMTALEAARGAEFRQIEALTDLHELLSPRAPMPASRGWAASPDVLSELVGILLARRPKLVVECGSGASSLWLGYALERAGEGRLVALEHDARYAELSRDLIRAHGLEHIVEVRYAPLRPWPDAGATARWYDTEVLTDLTDIGVLFVDGPPEATCPLARYPAGPVLLPRCADDAVVVLDDSARADERESSDRWLAEHPHLERTERAFEKGAHILSRRS